MLTLRKLAALGLKRAIAETARPVYLEGKTHWVSAWQELTLGTEVPYTRGGKGAERCCRFYLISPWKNPRGLPVDVYVCADGRCWFHFDTFKV